QLEHEAAWCSTFSCLKTSQTGDSQTGDSAGFQIIRLTEIRGLRLPDKPQEGRNRSWAVEEFSATLCAVLESSSHVCRVHVHDVPHIVNFRSSVRRAK
ncbi:hypothetical protein CSKR_113167, partial [Clonorchis sinensis]